MADGLVAIAVVVSDQHVLVGRCADQTPPWSFLGGKVEPGETPQQAAVREVREEAQLAITPLHVIGRRIHPMTGRELAAEISGQQPAVTAVDPALPEIRWATLDLRARPPMAHPTSHVTAGDRPGDRDHPRGGVAGPCDPRPSRVAWMKRRPLPR